MRVVNNDDECVDGFQRAKNESKASFGDDRIFAEKFITEPHHIEIQILADKKGNAIFLGERECSIQRRHQKVVEEAPSPFINDQTRQEMGAQAIALAKAVDYESAGTVEFIVDKNQNFYFLEMNTRLQVEHPVTEMVTGIDLVEQMIKVAYGEELEIKQSDIKTNGWAIESRVYAEDPYREFMPSIGRLSKYLTPDHSENVRVDTGIREGSEVSMFYDPMIAKLITNADNREQAIDRMTLALNSFQINGVNHNIDFLSAVMANPRFQKGKFNTGFIAEEFPSGFSGTELSEEIKHRMYSIATVFAYNRDLRNKTISGQINLARRAGFKETTSFCFSIFKENQRINLRLEQTDDAYIVSHEKGTSRVRGSCNLGAKRFEGAVDGIGMTVQVEQSGSRCRLKYNGCELNLSLIHI